MTRAKYIYKIEWQSGRNCIVIEDLDSAGAMSVTNDIENVVEEIGKLEGIDPNSYLIVYRDSMGIWDGWDNKKQDYVGLQCRSSEEAISKYIKKQLQ